MARSVRTCEWLAEKFLVEAREIEPEAFDAYCRFDRTDQGRPTDLHSYALEFNVNSFSVEGNIVCDDGRAFLDDPSDFIRVGGEWWRIGHHFIGDVCDARDLRRDGPGRLEEMLQLFLRCARFKVNNFTIKFYDAGLLIELQQA